MSDSILIKCKRNECNNPVIDGKYCEYCKKNRKEKRDNFIKYAGGVALSVGALVATVIFKKPTDNT